MTINQHRIAIAIAPTVVLVGFVSAAYLECMT
jgi:hypothetical protein